MKQKSCEWTNRSHGGYLKVSTHRRRTARWCTPVCLRCVNTPQTVLCPWIDWWSIGTIGYCQRCTRFFHVSSEWEQIPGTHSKAERDRLVSHEVVEIEFGNTCVIETAKVWAWHEALPGDRDMLDDIDAARKRIPMESVEAVLLSYMLWTLLWNVNAPSAHLLERLLRIRTTSSPILAVQE
jgi:hypothetical protein